MRPALRSPPSQTAPRTPTMSVPIRTNPAQVSGGVAEQPRAVSDRGVEHRGVGAGWGGVVGQGGRVDTADPVGVRVAGGDDERFGAVVLHRPDHRAHDRDALFGRRVSVETDIDVRGPETTTPNAVCATVPGLYGTSPTVAETGLSAGTALPISRMTHGKFALREPSSDFLTSTMSRCSAAFARSRASSPPSGEMRSDTVDSFRHRPLTEQQGAADHLAHAPVRSSFPSPSGIGRAQRCSSGALTHVRCAAPRPMRRT